MRRFFRALVAAAAIGVVLLAVAAGTQRAPAALGSAAPPSGAAVFASDLGIYVANLDGTGLKRLTRDGYDAGPVWSPDARRIAFNRFVGGLDHAVMVMNADGRGLRRIGSGKSLAWSPDGKRLAVAGEIGIVEGSTGRTLRPGLAGFWILSLDGTAPRPVETGTGSVGLSWSPDGRRIAFIGGGWARAYDLSSRTVTGLASVSKGTDVAAWSPNGKEVAVGAGGVYSTGEFGELAVVDVATRRVTKLTSSARAPVWSPDSTRIAFWGPKGLLTIGHDGRGRRAVDSAVKATGTVSWSGDGRSVLFSKPRSGGVGTDIWWGRTDGREAGRITQAFPTGASFSAPHRASTTIPGHPVPLVPAISVEPARELAAPSMVLRLAADEGRAALETPRCPVGFWLGGKLTWIARGTTCGMTLELELAGPRVGWVTYYGELFDRYLEIATRDTKPVTVDSAPEKYDYDKLGNLAGDGELLVFNRWRETHNGDITAPNWHPVDKALWRIDGTKKTKLAAGADAFPVVDVDAGRIAVLRDDGRLVILDRTGERLATFQLGRKGMVPEQSEFSEPDWPVRLTGRLVVALRGATIEVRDAATGTVRHRWPTVRSEAPTALEDARGNFAVYKAGIALHVLRLSDGRDRMLAIADEEGPVHAELERNGLYYSYNTPVGAKHGRVAFVPLHQLAARLG